MLTQEHPLHPVHLLLLSCPLPSLPKLFLPLAEPFREKARERESECEGERGGKRNEGRLGVKEVSLRGLHGL